MNRTERAVKQRRYAASVRNCPHPPNDKISGSGFLTQAFPQLNWVKYALKLLCMPPSQSTMGQLKKCR